MGIGFKLGIDIGSKLGTASDPYGSNLIENGDFSAGDTGWTILNNDWTISGGVAYVNNSFQDIRNSYVVETGITYLLEFDCYSESGTQFFPSQDSSVRVANGKYSKEVTFSSATTFRIRCDGTPAGNDYIDNVVLRKKL